MTAPYIQGAGVQKIAITIPTGATSATQTIKAVSTLAFILNNGFQSSATTETNKGFCRIELTNSTTVTAYRNTSDATITCIAYATVIDATSNLIVSAQSGTIAFAAGDTSKTATIGTSTNASYTVVHCLGFIDSATTLSRSNIEPLLTISGTTVTATRLFSGNTETVGFIVIEFAAAACNQAVQSYQKTFNSGSSATQTITSVNVNNALLIWAGSNGNTGASEAKIEQYATLTNATTVTININTAGSLTCNYNFFVVEFAAGVLAKAVQRGTTTLTAVNSATSTLSTNVSMANAFVNYLRYTASQTTANINNCDSDVVLTDGVTVTGARNGSTNNVTVSWEVAEFAGPLTLAGTGSAISEFTISEAPISGSTSVPAAAGGGLFLQSLLNGLGAGGPFFCNPLG